MARAHNQSFAPDHTSQTRRLAPGLCVLLGSTCWCGGEETLSRSAGSHLVTLREQLPTQRPR